MWRAILLLIARQPFDHSSPTTLFRLRLTMSPIWDSFKSQDHMSMSFQLLLGMESFLANAPRYYLSDSWCLLEWTLNSKTSTTPRPLKFKCRNDFFSILHSTLNLLCFFLPVRSIIIRSQFLTPASTSNNLSQEYQHTKNGPQQQININFKWI